MPLAAPTQGRVGVRGGGCGVADAGCVTLEALSVRIQKLPQWCHCRCRPEKLMKLEKGFLYHVYRYLFDSYTISHSTTRVFSSIEGSRKRVRNNFLPFAPHTVYQHLDET
jgi:hypothetical protein